MAMKFTEAADTGLITAATRAGLATTPADYSKAFESAAASYQETMEASTAAWDNLGKIIGMVGAEIKKSAIDWNSTAQKIYSAGGTDELVDELFDIQDELKDLGRFGGLLGNRETQNARRKILAKKDQIFAELDGWKGVLDVGSKAAEDETLDYNLMGLQDEEMFHAIIASNTNNKVTTFGHTAKVSRDKKTNKLMYTLHNKDGSVAKDIFGNDRTMSLPDFKALISDNTIDSEGVYSKAWNTEMQYWEKAGLTYGGEMNDYHKNQALTNIKNMTKTTSGLKRSMQTAFNGVSFADEIQGKSTLSQNIFDLMLENLPTVKTKKGTEFAKEGALAGVEDTDKSLSLIHI